MAEAPAGWARLEEVFPTELLWILTRENVVELDLKEELFVEDN